MATPKEAAVLFLTKVALDPKAPSNNRSVLEELLANYFPQDKMTDAKLEKIQVAYEQEVERIKRKYAQYMKGRGLK